ncbi:Mu-like prophage tail protein gpP [Pseudoxanthobacter soli DSM 19599]|uniref:Mu-like prophage tail protein gpP n=1 Tax=Pseudoxanthobacter soli DSM 19599 TaxID=1123029 RepID=A0A1M7ZLR0_9HYPH|nr:hypothetical protein [Pseudoxanthobacter soli]SHO65811.1 Mu-like prophage tail protein gpP [Pseudoxanthobacter soli DSM 19599]
MTTEIVTVSLGGARYTAWMRVMIRASLKEAARAFRLDVASESGPIQTAAAFRLFAPVDILAGGDLALRGFVDRRQARIGPEDSSLAISGRSLTADLIDCSAVHKTGEFRSKTVLEIAQALAKPFGVTCSCRGRLRPLPVARIAPGETVFRFVERLCRGEGLTLTGAADGGLTIIDGTVLTDKHAGGVIEGVNLYTGSSDFNGSNRYSEVRVLGQAGTRSGADALEIEAIARDQGVGRYRPLIVIDERDADRDTVRRRARGRRDRAAGDGISADVTVPGWRDWGGRLWTPGFKVWTESPTLGLAQDMLIRAVTLTQSGVGGAGGGTEAQLDLVDPRAFAAAAGKGAKSAEGWALDDSAAEDVA